MAILGTYSDPSILGHSALTTRVTITQPSSLLTQQSPRSKTKQHGWANFNYPLPPSLFLAQPVWKAPAWPPSQYIFNRNSYQWVFFFANLVFKVLLRSNTPSVGIKLHYHDNPLFSSPLQFIFNILIFLVQKNVAQPRWLPNSFICLPNHPCKTSLANIKQKW